MRSSFKTLLVVGAVALLLAPALAMAAGCCMATCLDEGACSAGPVVSRDGAALLRLPAAAALAPAAAPWAPHPVVRLAEPPPRPLLPVV